MLAKSGEDEDKEEKKVYREQQVQRTWGRNVGVGDLLKEQQGDQCSCSSWPRLEPWKIGSKR